MTETYRCLRCKHQFRTFCCFHNQGIDIETPPESRGCDDFAIPDSQKPERIAWRALKALAGWRVFFPALDQLIKRLTPDQAREFAQLVEHLTDAIEKLSERADNGDTKEGEHA